MSWLYLQGREIQFPHPSFTYVLLHKYLAVEVQKISEGSKQKLEGKTKIGGANCPMLLHACTINAKGTSRRVLLENNLVFLESNR